MKCFSTRIFFALFTFIVGIFLTALWIFTKDIPNVPIPPSEVIRSSYFGHNSELSLSERKFWEEEIFRRFKEKPLKDYSTSVDETYRLTLLPTFDAPLIIRIYRKGDERFLTTKKLSGQGGFGTEEFGKLTYEKTQILTETEWKTFVELLDQAFFLDLPTLDRNEVPVVDGAEFVVEGIQNGNFHDVHRISPNEELRAGYSYLLKLSGLEAEYEDYIRHQSIFG